MEQVRLFLEFAAVSEVAECLLDTSVSLQTHIQNIYAIRKERWQYRFVPDGSEIVYEKKTGQYLDTNVSLKALGLQDGMCLCVI